MTRHTGRSRGRTRAAILPVLVTASLVATPAGLPAGSGAAAAASTCGQRTKPEYLPELSYPLVQYSAKVALWDRGHDGAGVLVAVVDSGVEATNPHFSPPGEPSAIQPGTSLVPVGPVTQEGVQAQGLRDPQGHGTPVAGIIAARRIDGSGAIGLAPAATILPVQVYLVAPSDDTRLTPAFPNADQLARGIRYAADAGARIITVAMSQSAPDPALEAAVAYAHDKGALVVASAGDRVTAADTADSPRYPAAYPGVLSVTAVTASGQVSQASIHGDHVGVAAPGERITTAYGKWGDCVVGDAPATSYATPIVAATAALVAQAFPDEGPDLWKWRIEASAIRPRSDRRDPQLGWGLVSPYDALTITLDANRPGPALPGHAAAGTAAGATAATPVRIPPDPLAPARVLGLWLAGSALVGALAMRLLRTLRRPVEPRT